MTSTPLHPEQELIDFCADHADDPYGWVLGAYPWGEGELTGFDGPNDWQTRFLVEWGDAIKERGFDGMNAVAPYLASVTSGHGVGKSALVAWAVDFIMSTRPHSKGIVTANTSPQLETKTWAEIAKWSRRMITAHWFKVTTGRGAMKMVAIESPETWRVDGMAWRENQPEAFAGLHANTASPFYIFDEASGIPVPIYETAQGGMTDGEPFMFAFSNPTKPSGWFHDTFHRLRHRWSNYKVDSRTVPITNKGLIDQWIADYGLDSDFVRVRVLGLFPRRSAAQFIGTDLVEAARKREALANLTDPIIYGVDVARMGDDQSVIFKRKGRDGRTHKSIRLRETDTMQLAHRIALEARTDHPDAIFVDGGGVGGPVVDKLNELNIPNVIEANFGGKSPNRDHANLGVHMWANMRDWLAGGAIEDHDDLQADLTGREYFFDPKSAIMLEPKAAMKLRGLASPDWADALALTFAYPVGPRSVHRAEAQFSGQALVNAIGIDYDPHR